MTTAPPKAVLPRTASIECHRAPTLPDHLMVAARVYTSQPFGLSYYTRPGLFEDPTVAAQVLAYEHETFIRKLAKFLGEVRQGKHSR